MQTSEQINEVATALAAAQGEFPVIEKTKHAKAKGVSRASGKEYEISYAYADISDVLRHVLPVLAKHKLAVIQPTVIDEHGMSIRTRIMHASGQWIESEYPVCSIQGDHQKMGGALTYSRRYALCSLIGIAADEDTDAEEAAAPQPKAKAERVAPQSSNVRELPPKVSKPSDEAAGVDGLIKAIRETKSEADLQKVITQPDNIRVYEAAPFEQQERVSNAIAGHREAIAYMNKTTG